MCYVKRTMNAKHFLITLKDIAEKSSVPGDHISELVFSVGQL